MTLKIFSLANKSLKLDTAADIDAHIGDLISSDDVEEVRFLGNTLGVGACERLGQVLATKKSLKSADFSDIYTGRLLSEIPTAISSLLGPLINQQNLTTINLNDNAFGRNTVESILPFLSRHTPLQHLHLNNNGLGPDAGILVANALSELHARKEEARKAGSNVPDLETVICGRNRLESGSMDAWSRMLGLHTNIRTLRMVQNGIRPVGLATFFREGVSQAKQLRVLDLNDNTLTLAASKQLALVLPTLSNMTELNIGDAVLGNKGAMLIFQALGQGKSGKLEKLCVQYGEFNGKALATLVAAVEKLPLLRRIELNGNKFSKNHTHLEPLRELLAGRKKDQDDDDDDAWGLDELDELDYDSDEPEESDEEEEEEEIVADDSDQEKETPISAVEKDKDVLELTEVFEKTDI